MFRLDSSQTPEPEPGQSFWRGMMEVAEIDPWVC